VKKLPPRIAALTPSITAVLILVAVGLTALLAYRAFDASRAQQQTTEHTLREYAGFAAYQLKNATSGRMVGQHRGTFEHVVRAIHTEGPTPPLGPERVAALIEPKGPQCRCLDAVSFYYQVTLADSGIEATASALATPANLGRIRDMVIAHARAPGGPLPQFPNPAGAPPPGVPATSQWLASIFLHLEGRPYLLTHAIVLDATPRPVAAYGFAEPAGEVVRRAVSTALEFQPVLPNTLTRGLKVDSILAVTVTTPSGEVVYQSETRADTLYAATDSLEPRLGGLRFEVAIEPAAAGLLILGGVPRTRLPEVIATACVAVGLLGMLLYLFRRQEELARLRDEFVSGVSHELRTPLAQIRLLAELLHMGKVPAEEQDRSLRIIDKEARRLSFLVDSILSFTHSRRGRLSPVSTDIATEIDEIVSGFEPLAEAHGVRLTTRLEPGIVASVDRSALRQVVLNLLDNAVRYGPSGQDVTITTKAAGDTWTFEVADEGPGIPADERERIFAPYYRMERDTGGAVGGTGIGLAVVRRLVDEHGGRVHVASTNGDGATGAGARFVVALPVDMPGVNGR
jgi:signal transduction histidine kinase